MWRLGTMWSAHGAMIATLHFYTKPTRVSTALRLPHWDLHKKCVMLRLITPTRLLAGSLPMQLITHALAPPVRLYFDIKMFPLPRG